jgi:hypothetical protein
MSRIEMVAGDTRTLNLAVTRDGVAADLTGAFLWFVARGRVTSISKDSDSGIVIDDAVGGLATITLDPSDTSGASATETLHVEVQMRTASGAIETVVRGQTITVLSQLITES